MNDIIGRTFRFKKVGEAYIPAEEVYCVGCMYVNEVLTEIHPDCPTHNPMMTMLKQIEELPDES